MYPRYDLDLRFQIRRFLPESSSFPLRFQRNTANSPVLAFRLCFLVLPTCNA